MFKVSNSRLALLAAVVLTAACTVKETDIPPLAGPSEFALSITVAALPDTLTRDGASQSTIVVTARDWNGSPVPSVQLRVEMIALGVVQDFGTLSARTIFTGADGRATAFYTPPLPPPPGASSGTDRITIRVTPAGTNYQTAVSQTVEIKLVLPSTSTPGSPVAFFTYSPSAPTTTTLVQFNASGSYPVSGSSIVNYAWDWGDGETDNTNASSSENHDWTAVGTYYVTLTVTDNLGQKGSTTQAITIS